MRVKRGFGVILGGLVSLGGLAAIPAIGVPAGVASPSLRAATLAAYPANKSADNKSVVNKSAGGNSVVPEVGNPNGHVTVPVAGREVSTSHPNHVIGHGTPAGCTSAAVVKAVAEGGIITFDCGPKPVTILMKATAKVVNTSHRVVLDGGGKVTLSGGGKIRILYMNTCDPKQKYTTDDCWEQEWPQLVVQNLTFKDAYSAVRETSTSSYGGGAIFDQGGQLKVVDSAFIGNRCYATGPDLGGAAIRALGMYMKVPVYITQDTFTGNSCSNGAALSGLYANFAVYNSLMTGNKAIGWGANPASNGTAGGGSGGAIYTDGDQYNLLIDGTVITGSSAREGGGAIFFVVDAGGGTLKIEYSTLHKNPSGEFQNAPGIFDEVDGVVTKPTEIHSSVS
jgi:hypothetical protein